MGRNFTHYWKNAVWKGYERAGLEGTLLRYCTSDFAKRMGITSGDKIYIVTNIQGVLHVCAHLEVAKICNADEAADFMMTSKAELYGHDKHNTLYAVASAGSRMKFNNPINSETSEKLRFISGNKLTNLRFTSPNYLNEQTLRRPREIHPDSARILDSFTGDLEQIRTQKPTTVETLQDEHAQYIDSHPLAEGDCQSRLADSYERNSKARKACIEYYGLNCSVCGFNFEKTYGDHGKDFIHVHHLVPLSQIGEEHQVNPIKDLRPLCANCHAMAHRKQPPYSLIELQSMITK